MKKTDFDENIKTLATKAESKAQQDKIKNANIWFEFY